MPSESTPESNLIQAFKYASESQSYENFREIMIQKFFEDPEMFNCLDCPQEAIKASRMAFVKPTYEEFKTALESMAIPSGNCAKPSHCPRNAVVTAVEEASGFEQFKDRLRSLLN